MSYIYDDAGRIRNHKRTGLPLVNLGEMTPCHDCEKVPERVFDEKGIEIPKNPATVKKLRGHAVEMTPIIAKAWQHYLECRAVGSFPDDPIVRQNAALFRHVADEADKQRDVDREQRLIESILAAIPRAR